jgi:3-hydroxyacyl-[acyl-carrier-protein] dehydratase
MLKDNFYTINAIEQGEKNVFAISLNANHKIFEGHFPGNPITPGVCLTQMVKEAMEHLLHKKLTMVTGDNIKFTAVLNPLENPSIILSLGIKTKDNGLLQGDATVAAGEQSFFSFKGSFKEA